MSRLIHSPSFLFMTVLWGACQTIAFGQSPATPANAAPALAPSQRTVPTVEFRVAQTQAAPDLVEVHLVDGSIWTSPRPLMTRNDLKGVGSVKNQQGQPYVQFNFSPSGTQKLAALSQQNVGKLILLSVNGRLSAIAKIGGPMPDGTLLLPAASEPQAVAVANAIIGPSPAPGK